jgi:hypothetical protein
VAMTLDSLFKECKDFINKEHPNFGNEETLSKLTIKDQYSEMYSQWKTTIFESEEIRAQVHSRINKIDVCMRAARKRRFLDTYL